MIETEIISFYGVSENVGSSTLSSAFALKLAEGGKRVLYIEADYTRPSFAFSTGLSHPNKNMGKLMDFGNEFNLLDYIATKNDIISEMKSVPNSIKKLPEEFYFLAFPSDYVTDLRASIEDKEVFLNSFKQSIINAPFDYVIVNVPSEISELLSYPILETSNRIVHVLGSRPLDSITLRRLQDELEEHGLALAKEQYNVFNFFNKDYVHEVKKVSGLSVDISIPYDEQRAQFQWGLLIGSPIIDEKMVNLIEKMDIEVHLSKKPTEKRFFSFA